MKRLLVWTAAFMMMWPVAWSLTQESSDAFNLQPLRSPAPRWFSKIEIKNVQPYTLAQVYDLQVNYPEERLINLKSNNYLISFDQESVEQYLGVTKAAPSAFLREVSGKTLGLLLYKLGGDGTDHYQDCHSWLTKQLPSKQFSTYATEWSATYSGVIVDFHGSCRSYSNSSVFYVYAQITYDPALGTGELFVGAEDLTSTLSIDLFEPAE